MKTIKITCFVLLVMFGIFMFVYGGYDDSPGAQGLGFLLVITGITYIVKTIKRSGDAEE